MDESYIIVREAVQLTDQILNWPVERLLPHSEEIRRLNSTFNELSRSLLPVGPILTSLPPTPIDDSMSYLLGRSEPYVGRISDGRPVAARNPQSRHVSAAQYEEMDDLSYWHALAAPHEFATWTSDGSIESQRPPPAVSSSRVQPATQLTDPAATATGGVSHSSAENSFQSGFEDLVSAGPGLLELSDVASLATNECTHESRIPQTECIQEINVQQENSRHRCFLHGCDGRAFANSENYRRHIRERTRSGQATCDYCFLPFTRKSNRDKHIVEGKCKALNAYNLHMPFGM